MKESAGRMKESAGRILMLLENPFPNDIRVWNEALTLTRAGYRITVISLRREGEGFTDEVEGIRVYRIPTLTLFGKKSESHRSGLGKLLNPVKLVLGYGGEYFYFTFLCLLLSLYIAFKEGFDVIHAHNPPDTLFIIGAVFKPFGKKFVFDHHDLSPELYQSRFGVQNGFVSSALLALEKLSLRLSNISIATNESYKKIQISRGNRPAENVFVVRNGPDFERVKPVPPDEDLKKMDKIILVYVGAMNPQDGIDYMLRALRYLVYEMGRSEFFCVAIGPGDSLEDLKTLSEKLELDSYIRFTGFIPEEDLIRYLSTADICIDPNPSSPLNDLSTWIKVMEYMAMEKPIVSFDLKETRFTAREAALYVTPNNETEFAEAIAKLMDNPDLRREMGRFGRKRVETELQWQLVSQNLLAAYEALHLEC